MQRWDTCKNADRRGCADEVKAILNMIGEMFGSKMQYKGSADYIIAEEACARCDKYVSITKEN